MSNKEVAPEHHPMYIIKSYLWEAIKNNTNATEADYRGRSPIIPLSDEPEFVDGDKPFVVYGFSLMGQSEDIHMKQANMALVFKDYDIERKMKWFNIATEAFGKFDDSASRINEWSSWYKAGTPNVIFDGIRFGHVRVIYSEEGEPEVTEGARSSAVLDISLSYFVNYSIKQFYGPGTRYRQTPASSIQTAGTNGIWLYPSQVV